MKKLFNSLIAAIITALFILTGSFMIMLFSSGEEGYRTTYFNSLFFNSYSTSDGRIEMNFGIENGIPILITIAILFVLFVIVISYFKKKSVIS